METEEKKLAREEALLHGGSGVLWARLEAQEAADDCCGGARGCRPISANFVENSGEARR